MNKLTLKEMIKQELIKYPIHKLFHEKLADDLVELFKQWMLSCCLLEKEEILQILKSDILNAESNIKSIRYYKKLHKAFYRNGRFKGHSIRLDGKETISKEEYENNHKKGERLNKEAFMDKRRRSYYTYHKEIKYYENDKDKLLAKIIYNEIRRRIEEE